VEQSNVYTSLSFTFFNVNVNEMCSWILDAGRASEVHSRADIDFSLIQNRRSLW